MSYESNIANEVLYSPFDDMGEVPKEIRRKLTEDVFLKECYCLPSFLEDAREFNDDSDVLLSAVKAYLGDDCPLNA